MKQLIFFIDLTITEKNFYFHFGSGISFSFSFSLAYLEKLNSIWKALVSCRELSATTAVSISIASLGNICCAVVTKQENTFILMFLLFSWHMLPTGNSNWVFPLGILMEFDETDFTMGDLIVLYAWLFYMMANILYSMIFVWSSTGYCLFLVKIYQIQ